MTASSAKRKRVPGQGTGADYTASIQVKRGGFSSRGRSHVIPSPLFPGTDRAHDVLSDLERCVFMALLTWRPRDIQEQFPLDLETTRRLPGTLEIAELLGLKHPPYKKATSKAKSKGMSTDFLVTRQDRAKVAINCKYGREVDDSRNVELRLIEGEYWRLRGSEVIVVTERSMPAHLEENLLWAYSAMTSDPALLARIEIPARWMSDLVENISARRCRMKDALTELGELYGLSMAQQVVWLKLAVLFGLIEVDHSAARLNLRAYWDIKATGEGRVLLLEEGRAWLTR